MTADDSERSIVRKSRLAHRLWVHWSTHIAEEEDISEERLERWRRMWVPFKELPESQQLKDRQLVQRFGALGEVPDAYDNGDTGTDRQERGSQ